MKIKNIKKLARDFWYGKPPVSYTHLPRYGVQRLLAFGYDYLLPARHGAVAVAVRNDHGAAALYELCEARVVVLGA